MLYQLSYFRKGFSEKHALLAEMRVQRYAIFLNGQKKCVTFLLEEGFFVFFEGVDGLDVLDILDALESLESIEGL